MIYITLTLVLSLTTAATSFLFKDGLNVIISYGIIVPLLVLIPRTVFMLSSGFRNSAGAGWLKKVEPVVFLVVLVNAPASLFIHDMDFQYDRFLHFVVGACLPTLFLANLMPIQRMIGRSASWTGLKKPALILIIVGLFAFEGLQFSVDKIFGTQLFHDTNQPITVDFWEDIFFGAAGVVAGLTYAKKRIVINS